MQKIVLTAILTSLSVLTFAQEKSPKKEIVYRKIEIKGNDTIVDITKNYDQLSEVERKELDNFRNGDVLFAAPKRIRVKKLDSAAVGMWKEDKNKEIVIMSDDAVFAPNPKHRFEKRISVSGDSTKRKKIIVIEADGDEQMIMPMRDENMIIEREPMPGKKMMLKKRFSPAYELNFALPVKGSVDVVIKDEEGKEVYKETVKNFTGNFSKKIELLPGKYTVVASQKGKQLVSYTIER
ncbi:hypothetical protein [Solitalea canadensis]|uniref:Uncharacterized protein n=1 Tax=Solitalea canadensis (strain ATCC 29591 / DSM 3403 / JCM 21819 / LMG 8368 / NBRC 15130 / NCIMB 12057 / USAM 9D) TaxID=929556 RepID=H8KM11_SOLCM|nr:hypothetical protein [Solitalea canadensis]AFD08933.1 hypothetical protein Solca_3938 [Solitalea canadensis DSM 3403]